MTSVSEVKQRLSAIWGKESDPSETYEFDFSGEKWTCTRSNAHGPSKFKLSFDDAAGRLWWGQSYFTEPEDLKAKPSKIVWYRAADSAKKKGAFLWQKLKDVKLKEPVVQSKAKAKPKVQPSVQASSAPQRWQPKAQPAQTKAATPVVVVKKPQSKAAQPETSGKSGTGAPPSRSRSQPEEDSSLTIRAGGAKGWPMPEIIFDLKDIAVIYKPPYWKCELPDKDADLSNGPSLNDVVKRGPRDALILLRWIKERVSGIDASLFREDFNPALSGTGFGPLAHRIDQETSGLLLVAKNSGAQRHLKSQFWNLEVSKRYVCLVHGVLKKREGTVDASIRTIRTDYSTKSEVSSAGEWAQTRYEVIATYSASHRTSTSSRLAVGYSLVACDITSGRTHQIRVHMQHLGHPLVADDKYQSKEEVAEDRLWCPRLFLHSYRLCFRDLADEDVLLTCPLPLDLKSALKSLGVSDKDGSVSDLMFGETSWQREILRPDQSKWRPSSRIERSLADMLMDSNNKPIQLNQLNSNPEFKKMLQEEGVSGIGKTWLYKHWDLFEVVEDQETDDLRITLRIHDSGDNNEKEELERQIEAVQSELENLTRRKHRAVAEEDYDLAAEMKKRVEVATQELSSLRLLHSRCTSHAQQDVADNEHVDRGTAAMLPDKSEDKFKGAQSRNKQPQAFSQDVKDETLFPSLGGDGPKSAFPALGAPSAKRVPSTDRRATSTDKRAPSADRAVTKPATAAAASPATTESVPEPQPQPEQVDPGPPDLKEAIVEFLLKREGYVAHMNEINNDKQLRQVMKAQQPKPMQAVNKAWLKNFEDIFAILHSKEGEMYLGLEAKARPKSAAASRASSLGREKRDAIPAYHQVIQKPREEAAPPLVYSYSQKEKSAEPEKDGAKEWADLFLDVIRRSPERSCSIDALLEAVPLFAKGIGARRISEQRELLTIFLQGCPEKFKLEKKGFGPDRKYFVWPK